MRTSYPKSFRTFLLIGFLVVVLPLVVALVHSVVSINELSQQSRQLVYLAAQASQASRTLIETVTEMERSARQFEVLEDRALFATYARHHERFAEAGGQLAALPMQPAQRDQLNDAMRLEQAIFDGLGELDTAHIKPGPRRAGAFEPLLARFSVLSAAIRDLRTMGNEVIDQEVAAFRLFTDRAQRLVLWQLAGTLGVAVLLVGGFTLLLHRPIRDLDRAIRQLGNAKFDQAIQINGPMDLELLGHRLDWLRRRLAALEDQRTRVLRHVSHELKTPLTALREGSDLLSEGAAGELSAKQAELVRILRVNSLRLQRLIEELLSYNEAEHEMSLLNLQDVELATLVQGVIGDQHLACQAKNLTVSSECGDVRVEADSDKLRVIVDNLLSNAVKHSPLNGVIRIGARNEDGRMVLQVADQGPGIPDTELPRVFEPFFKGRAKVSGPLGGTGLGLAIVQDLVHAHRGTIAVANLPGAGTCFTVTLPAKLSSSESN